MSCPTFSQGSFKLQGSIESKVCTGLPVLTLRFRDFFQYGPVQIPTIQLYFFQSGLVQNWSFQLQNFHSGPLQICNFQFYIFQSGLVQILNFQLQIFQSGLVQNHFFYCNYFNLDWLIFQLPICKSGLSLALVC